MAEETVNEEWRPIDWYPPGYEVSSLGRVRSVDRIVERPGPIGEQRRKGKILSPYPSTKGYLLVDISQKFRAKKVHILVCRAFNGPAPNGKPQVAHWDGDRTNNAPGNLRWVTNQENQDDEKRHGTRIRGSNKWNAKLTEKDIPIIRRMRSRGFCAREIADRFCVSVSIIYHVCDHRTWSHVP